MLISIASGKGGTGKTLVATSLACAIKDTYSVELIDCDVEEPNAHIFINPEFTVSEVVETPVPKIDESKCNHCAKCSKACVFNAIAILNESVLTFPDLCHGCGVCAFVCERKAITEVPYRTGLIEKGYAPGIKFKQGKLDIGRAMATPVIKKLKEDAGKEQDVTFIDSPPGTSCSMVEAVDASDLCLLVTESTPFGLNDLELALQTINQLGVPGAVIINRARPEDRRVEQYCQQNQVPILMQIPLDYSIARLYSKGITLALGSPQWRENFRHLFEKTKELVR